ncbi:MAG: flavodoxin [Bacteroidales bacterium]|nr:flavodoxin [Bacteroidales bacterium]MCI1785300.1 flavodoxin [Bacteroidales bacterium]
MKILLTALLIVMTGFYGNAQVKNPPGILIAYFSCSGNTRVIARDIQKECGGTMFEIQPVKPYPAEYRAVVEQARQEIEAGYKPELKTKVENFDSYDIIFIGSPNWWGTVPPPVATFLSSYDFKGKTILQFITHGGSSFGRSSEDIRKLCPDSKILKGYSCRGSMVGTAAGEVHKWLTALNLGSGSY